MLDQRTAAARRSADRDAAVAASALLAFAAGCWVVATRRMSGMDMGVETHLGPFGGYLVGWVAMTAAMMLPGATPAVVRRVRADGVGGVPLLVGTYLAVWTAVGVLAYAAYRPHGTTTAGAVVLAAGLYELTPLKARGRHRCRETTASGGFSVGCVASSIGLMAALLAVGAMSEAWMAIVAVLAIAQKLLPPRAAVDVPVALAILGLGALVLVAPSSLPGLVPGM
jgi:predicted metal-binding membrane protein